MVLLKYGEIMAQFDRNSIYIPIWYYLNDGQTVDEIFDSELIYIPIWYYLNIEYLNKIICLFLIYIPIWYYLNEILIVLSDIVETFTFQYGTT